MFPVFSKPVARATSGSAGGVSFSMLARGSFDSTILG